MDSFRFWEVHPFFGKSIKTQRELYVKHILVPFAIIKSLASIICPVFEYILSLELGTPIYDIVKVGLISMAPKCFDR